MNFKRRLRFIFRHLSVRLIAVSVLVIVPLNVLTLILLQEIVTVYEDRLIYSHQSQLDQHAAHLDSMLRHAENQVSAYLSAVQVNIMIFGTEGSNEVEFIRIFNEVRRIRNAVDLPSLGYVRDNVSGLSAVSAAPTAHAYTHLMQVNAALDYMAATGGFMAGYTPFFVDENAYLLQMYMFSRFSFGILIDINRLLDEIPVMGHGTAYLLAIDGEETIPGYIEPATGPNLLNLTSSLPSLGYYIVYTVHRDQLVEAVPTMVRTLRILAILSVLALPLIGLVTAYHVIRPLKAVVNALSEVEKGNLDYQLEGKTGTFQMDYIYHVVNHMSRELKSLIIDAYEQEIEKLKTDALNLRLQVRPHMLLNSLNTIYSLALSKEHEQVMHFSNHLIQYFRYVLRQESALVPLREEIAFIKHHLEIQKIRYPNSFVIEYQIDPLAEEVRIPPLIIENFVENAAMHALNIGNCINIKLTVEMQDNRLFIEISDNGRGIDPEIMAQISRGDIINDRMGNHIGIWNCRQRLKLYYDDKASLQIESAIGEGTKVYLELPLVPLDATAGSAWAGKSRFRR